MRVRVGVYECVCACRAGTHVHEELEDALADEEAGQRAVGHGREPVAEHVQHIVLEERELQVLLDQLRHRALQHRHLHDSQPPNIHTNRLEH